MTEFIYSSPFQEFIQGMIHQKRSLGYKYDSDGTLYRFDQFCLAYGCTEPVYLKNSSMRGARSARMRRRRPCNTG